MAPGSDLGPLIASELCRTHCRGACWDLALISRAVHHRLTERASQSLSRKSGRWNRSFQSYTARPTIACVQ
jgi:hypothetical protein